MAPMEGVTDTVFRRVIAECGRPTVFYTEFTNVDGLFSKGRKHVEHRLLFEKSERPLVAQIWGMTPVNYTKAAQEIKEMGFDAIDINMGCPEKGVVARGACAGMIHNRELAAEIIEATKIGAPDLPISVKTRIGIQTIETEDWISFLLKQDLDALIVHSRTVSEQSRVPAHWEEMKKVVKLKNELSPNTIIIGNGDVESRDEAHEKCETYGIDGVMVGRGIFKDPYLFHPEKRLENMTKEERFKLLLHHSTLFESTWGEGKNFEILRKFYKIYTHGLPNASDLREKLMQTKNLSEVKKIINIK